MSLFLTPSLKPIYGGTYFPATRVGNQMTLSFPTLLDRVYSLWMEKSPLVIHQSEQTVEVLKRVFSSGGEEEEKSSIDVILQNVKEYVADGVDNLLSHFDREHGGFSLTGPKFPQPIILQFLLRRCIVERLNPNHTIQDMAICKRALSAVEWTLSKMSRGGIYDHLGGGFHRYSVDTYWHVPHFEKMMVSY